MQTKHTAGKWQTWVLDSGESFLTNEGQLALMSSHRDDEDAKRICLVDAHREDVKKKDLWMAPDHERSANAKLIAAAPTMLDTLQSVLTTFEAMVSNPEIEGMKYVVQEAISQATH